MNHCLLLLLRSCWIQCKLSVLLPWEPGEIIQLDIKKNSSLPLYLSFCSVLQVSFKWLPAFAFTSFSLWTMCLYKTCITILRFLIHSLLLPGIQSQHWKPQCIPKDHSCVHYVCGYFHATIAELSSCKRDHMTKKKTEHICYFILIEKVPESSLL